MGYIEDLWETKSGAPTARHGTGKRYRAVPWLAGAPGMRGRRGPTQTFHEYRDAEIYCARIEHGDDTALTDAGLGSKRRADARTFAEYVVEVAATMGSAKATRDSYASMARNLAQVWPTQRLQDITDTMIDEYLGELHREGRSPSLRAKRRTVLLATFTRAYNAGLIPSNPMTEVRPVNQPKRRRKREVTEKEFQFLLEETAAWLRPALMLAYDLGMRSGELCGLRWCDVYLEDGDSKVVIENVMLDDHTLKNETKNGVTDEVPLTERCVWALRAHLDRFPGGANDYVFREPKDSGLRPIWPARYRALFNRSCRLASIRSPWPHPHDLRHGCAERLAKAGVSVYVIQRIMRHLDIGSTQIYLPTVTTNDMRAAFAVRGEE